MASIVSDQDLDTLFRAARSHSFWRDEPVTDVQLEALYDLTRWGPTSANCSPARIVFVKSPEAKAKLIPCVSAGNSEKVRTAPVTAIIGYDRKFYDRIPELFPHNPGARDWFTEPAVAEETAFRNSSLQGGYFILAARALGLDCGPMSGFDKDQVDAAFFAGTDIRSNFLCTLGYGVHEKLFPRSPRLSFSDACSIL